MSKGEPRRGNHDGHVRRRGDGRYEVQMQFGGRRRSFYGKTEGEAKRKGREALRAYERGEAVTVGRLTVGAWLDEWLTNDAKPSVRPGTWRSYDGHVRLYIRPAIGHVRLTRLTGSHVQRMQAELLARGLSAQTVHNVRATLHRALERAVKLEHVGRNVVDLVDAPKVRREPVKGMTPADARAILAAFAGHPMEAFVTVTLLAGLRRSEALGLAWSDVDMDGGTLTIRHQLLRVAGSGVQLVEPKTDKRRGQVLPLAAEAVAALRRHRVAQGRARLLAGGKWHDSGMVFTTGAGTPMDGAAAWHAFQDGLAAAGLPAMRVHDLRHGFGTLTTNAGTHPRVVSELMGHTRIATTMDVYAQALPDTMRDAVVHLDDVLTGAG